MSGAVEDFYNRTVATEWSRLERHPLEFEITKRHIDQFLTPQSRILDLWGGPGRYTLHYAAAGHRVTLADLSPKNVEFARQKALERGVPVEQFLTADATALATLPDRSFDFVLCLGPLYHLTDPRARTRVLRECRRVLKDEGRALFGFITHMAQTLSVIKRSPDNLAAWEPSLVQGIETGLNDTAFDTGFTEAFFVRPDRIGPLVEAEGYRVLKLAGAEGLACQSEEVLKALPAPGLDRWIDFLFRYSDDPTTLGANQHVVCVAEKAL